MSLVSVCHKWHMSAVSMGILCVRGKCLHAVRAQVISLSEYSLGGPGGHW